jgi:hypothetical protein
VRYQPSAPSTSAGRDGILVVALEEPGRAHEHLAAVADLDLDALDRHADGVVASLVVGLQADEHRGLGRAVELLQVDADRAVEDEQVGADRLARGVGDAHAREAERVAQRRVDEQVADRVGDAIEERERLAVHARRADAAGERHAAIEEPALRPRRILHADRHRRQQPFEDARRREVVRRPDLAQVEHHGASPTPGS